jgi:hypothetical protein
MTFDEPDDRVMAAIANLATCDVSPARGRRLRERCHARMRAHPRRNLPIDTPGGTPLRRVIGPALAGAWCLAYLAAIIRFAAAVYGF